jgi:hypothetical protein
VSLPTGNIHHSSHRHLLRDGRHSALAGQLDAIVVPSFRTAPYLDHAVSLADKLGCLLLVLCSGDAKPVEVADRMAPHNGHVAAIDVTGLEMLLPSLRTLRLPRNEILHRPADIAYKRNLGLLIARLAGWQRMVFLDDDIAVPRPQELRYAAGLVGRYDAVGLANDGFPDNSVVCHAHRAAGGRQDTFIGGGAMVIAPQSCYSFFPDLYNEDWFFLISRDKLASVGTYGKVTQKEFDPFADPLRAQGEEFGDCLAEGLYWLLDQGRAWYEADAKYWAAFLDRRRRLIDDITLRLKKIDLDPAKQSRILAALEVAEASRSSIEPTDCVEYLQAWRDDRRHWQDHVNRLSPEPSLSAALKRIGVPVDRMVRPDAVPRLTGLRVPRTL